MPNPDYWGWEPPATLELATDDPVFGDQQPVGEDHYQPDDLYDDLYDDQIVDEVANSAHRASPDEDHGRGLSPAARMSPGALRDRVRRVLRSTLSALHGADPASGLQLLERIGSSDRVLRVLTDDQRRLVRSVIEVLVHEASVLATGRLDLRNLPVIAEYSDDVALEIRCIVEEIGVSTPADAHAYWHDLVEGVQRAHTRHAANDLVRAIDAKEPVFDLMEHFRQIEPPTMVKSVSRERSARTAREVSEAVRSVTAGRVPYRFSSGLPTLDLGYTGLGEAPGFIAPGQFNVVMGPTGTGKSSFANSIVPAINLDMKNWGLQDAMQVVFHTEEESIDKLKGFRMDVGQKYHHLSDNLVIDACGTSRRRLAETLYDLVIRADERSRVSKRPITEFLPYVVQIDYIQSIQEPGDKDPASASAITAEFFLRGVCAWNPEEMKKFSGVDFREYAGAAWPAGMEHHRVAVVAYAQLVKIDDSTLYYQKDKRNVQLSDFVLLNERDEASWDVKEGDLRLFGKNQMRGSGVIAQNAHAIVILHRSVPYNNPAYTDADGALHLRDTRARILFDKSRSGSRMSYAPMRFDVQSTGFRAQYFDEVAERAIEAGKLRSFDPSYSEPGDPILPLRPFRDPFVEVRY